MILAARDFYARLCFGRVVVALALAMTTASVFAVAAEPQLPPAEWIFNKYLETTGGRAAHEKARNYFMEGAIFMGQDAPAGTVKIWAAKPDLTYCEQNLAGAGISREGTYEHRPWLSEPEGMQRLREGVECAFYERWSVFNYPLNWSKVYPKGECVGFEDVNGVRCYKVALSVPGEQPDELYFGVDNHLLLKLETSIVTNLANLQEEQSRGRVRMSRRLENYRDADGILTPFTFLDEYGGDHLEMRFTRVQYNIDIPKDRFLPPPAIVKMIEESKAKEREGAAKAEEKGSKKGQ